MSRGRPNARRCARCGRGLIDQLETLYRQAFDSIGAQGSGRRGPSPGAHPAIAAFARSGDHAAAGKKIEGLRLITPARGMNQGLDGPSPDDLSPMSSSWFRSA